MLVYQKSLIPNFKTAPDEHDLLIEFVEEQRNTLRLRSITRSDLVTFTGEKSSMASNEGSFIIFGISSAYS